MKQLTSVERTLLHVWYVIVTTGMFFYAVEMLWFHSLFPPSPPTYWFAPLFAFLIGLGIPGALIALNESAEAWVDHMTRPRPDEEVKTP